MKPALTFKELMLRGKTEESDDDLSAAVATYEEASKRMPYHREPYGRMMILFRKHGELKKELAVINKAITQFLKFHDRRTDRGKKMSSSVAKISKILSRELGLVDRKGNNMHIPEPIAGWIRRKKFLVKKITR